MNKCVICSKDSGKGVTCSSKCRQVLSRFNKANPETSVTKGVTDTKCDKPSVTAIDPQVQAIWDRRNAQGQPAAYPRMMTHTEPRTPTLPGDVDYEGCVVKVEGVWTTKESLCRRSHSSLSGQTQAIG